MTYEQARELEKQGSFDEAYEIYKTLYEQGGSESILKTCAWVLYKSLKKHIQEKNQTEVEK